MLLACGRCGIRRHFAAVPEEPYLCDNCRGLPAGAPAVPLPELPPAPPPAPARGLSPRTLSLMIFGGLTAAGAIATHFVHSDQRPAIIFAFLCALVAIAVGSIMLSAAIRWFLGSTVTPVFCLATTASVLVLHGGLCSTLVLMETAHYLPALQIATLLILGVHLRRAMAASWLEAIGTAGVVALSWAVLHIMLLAPFAMVMSREVRNWWGLQ